MNGRYAGKRFASLILVVLLLALGFFLGRPEMFGSFSTALGVLYGVYLTGQSYTDGMKAKNGD